MSKRQQGRESRVLKTEYDRAIILAEKESWIPSEEVEKEFLTKYLYSHKLMAKRIIRHLESIRATRNAQAKG